MADLLTHCKLDKMAYGPDYWNDLERQPGNVQLKGMVIEMLNAISQQIDDNYFSRLIKSRLFKSDERRGMNDHRQSNEKIDDVFIGEKDVGGRSRQVRNGRKNGQEISSAWQTSQ